MENNPEIQKIKDYMATNPPLPPEFNIEDLLYPENPITVDVSLNLVSSFLVY